MQKLLAILLVTMCLQSMAQNPPKIRKPGSSGQTVETSGPVAYSKGVIPPNTSLVKNQRYYSADNRYCLVFQPDGNLVMYKFSTPTSFKAVWNTHTNGMAINKCVFQTDGNLVLYDYTNKAKWDARTDAKNRADKKKGWGKYIPQGDKFTPVDVDNWMTVQNDGNLVIYNGTYPQIYSVVWASDTFEKN